MSIQGATDRVQRAIDTMHTIAETKDPRSNIITMDLDIIPQPGVIRKIAAHLLSDSYTKKIDPVLSAKVFKRRLATIISSQPYLTKPALREVCRQASKIFNDLIITANNELPDEQRYQQEEFLVDFEKEERYMSISEKIKIPINGATIIEGPGNPISRTEYNRLFGKQQTPSPINLPGSGGQSIHSSPKEGYDSNQRISPLFKNDLNLFKPTEIDLKQQDSSSSSSVMSDTPSPLSPQNEGSTEGSSPESNLHLIEQDGNRERKRHISAFRLSPTDKKSQPSELPFAHHTNHRPQKAISSFFQELQSQSTNSKRSTQNEDL